MKPFLSATAALHTSVNAKSIVIALVDRLSNYVLNEKAAGSSKVLKLEGKDGDLFTVFTEQLAHIIDGRESLELEVTNKSSPFFSNSPKWNRIRIYFLRMFICNQNRVSVKYGNPV